MVPSFPIELPDQIKVNQLKSSVADCSMLYLEQRCNNSASCIILFWGSYIAICGMCIGNMPDGWIEGLERKIVE
jgi:hypothetical protein